MSVIYKIATAGLWREAEAAGAFAGAPIDLRDGYIHFSTAGQVRDTARLHFGGVDELLLVAVDTGRLPPGALRHEPSRGGQLFPHLYGPLPIEAVLWAKPLPLGPDGIHVFPDDVP